MNVYRKYLISALAAMIGLAVLTMPGSAATVADSYGHTLTTPTTPSLITGPNGFIKRWFVLDPIPARGLTRDLVQAMAKKQYFPDQYSIIPKNGEQETVDGKTLTWRAVDTRLYNVDLRHYGQKFHQPWTNVLFWAVTIVNSPREMQNVRLAIGSNAASVWWLNGQEVIGIYGDRQTVIDDGVSKRVTLKKGPNVVRTMVVNAGGATDFCARFLDSDSKPIKGLTVTLREPHP